MLNREQYFLADTFASNDRTYYNILTRKPLTSKQKQRTSVNSE